MAQAITSISKAFRTSLRVVWPSQRSKHIGVFGGSLRFQVLLFLQMCKVVFLSNCGVLTRNLVAQANASMRNVFRAFSQCFLACRGVA